VDILRSLKERCDPKYAALIVVDVQNDFVSPQGSAAKRGEDVSAAMAMVPNLRKCHRRSPTRGIDDRIHQDDSQRVDGHAVVDLSHFAKRRLEHLPRGHLGRGTL
jgi:hypothetical protein